MIKISNVTKKYGDFFAVNNLSLTVNQSEFLVILGPSGCGKSTLLRLINKMIKRDSGEIEVEGDNIDDLKGEELRKTIGYVIQSIGLFPHMDVKKNIATVPHLLKWKEDRIDKRVNIMIDWGLIEEVKKLLEIWYKEIDFGMKTIWYEEIISYLNWKITLDEAISQIQQNSRNYAKRQLTWFRTYDKFIEKQ